MKLWIPALVGAGLGLAGSLFVLSLSGAPSDLAESIHDWANPVLDGEAKIVTRTDKEWLIVMYSRKHRDCRLLEVQAHDVGPGRDVNRLQFARQDGAQPSGMPVGNFRSATYIIMPPPSHRLQLSFLHECNGRTVRTPVKVKE